jgi:hypothetical protein
MKRFVLFNQRVVAACAGNSVGASGMGLSCMSATRTPEDDWFVANVCPTYKFACLASESAADCATANAAQCEVLRTEWLGNIGLLPFPPMDTTQTVQKNSASDVVVVSTQMSWFDGTTPLADFSKGLEGGKQPKCGYRPSTDQDETEYDQWITNGDTPLPSNCSNTFPADFASTYPNTLKGVLEYLLDHAWDEFNSAGAFFSDTAAPAVRKDIRTLTAAERTAYMAALRKTECLGFTHLWAAIHESSVAQMHSGPAFLPAHSIYMRIYELALQLFGDLGTSVPLHIAGWNVDFSLPATRNGRIRDNSLWGNDYLGPIANQNMGDGTLPSSNADNFPNAQWATPSVNAQVKTLERDFRNVEQRGGYVAPQDVWNAMAITDATTFGCFVEQGLLHGGQHMVISGHMGDLETASWDAVFFMHHGFVDCLWRNWQMQGASASDRAQYPTVADQQGWMYEKANDAPHWAQWTSPLTHAQRQISHADAYAYRNQGRGSYKCIIPGLLPCQSDQDCGVPVGQARSDQRLYCSTAQVCAQYIESGSICRNELGAFLPCQKETDRCQYSPVQYQKVAGSAPSGTSQNDAWFCIPSPALACGSNTDANSCGSAQGCTWIAPSASGVQSCPNQVSLFGYGVSASSASSGGVVPLGPTFDFKNTAWSASNTKSWTLTSQGLSAVVSAAKVTASGVSSTASYTLFKDTVLGVKEASGTSAPSCGGASSSGAGDTPDLVDRDEAIVVTFSQTVTLSQLNVGSLGANGIIDIEYYNAAGTLTNVERYKTPQIVFGVSTASAMSSNANVCPAGGCQTNKIVVYGIGASDSSMSSAVGMLAADGTCVPANPGVGFSVDLIAVSGGASVASSAGGSGSMASSTPTTFTGYCTGAPDSTGDYQHCAPQDSCFLTTPTQGSTNVDLILVPAGTCGPAGWIPQVRARVLCVWLCARLRAATLVVRRSRSRRRPTARVSRRSTRNTCRCATAATAPS